MCTKYSSSISLSLMARPIPRTPPVTIACSRRSLPEEYGITGPPKSECQRHYRLAVLKGLWALEHVIRALVQIGVFRNPVGRRRQPVLLGANTDNDFGHCRGSQHVTMSGLGRGEQRLPARKHCVHRPDLHLVVFSGAGPMGIHVRNVVWIESRAGNGLF